MLAGFELSPYLSLTNMFSKFLGLTCTLAASSTLFLGKVVRKITTQITHTLSILANIMKLSILNIGAICAHFHHGRSLSGQTVHSHTSQWRRKITAAPSLLLSSSLSDIYYILHVGQGRLHCRSTKDRCQCFYDNYLMIISSAQGEISVVLS